MIKNPQTIQKNSSQRGFMMPAVVILFGISTIVLIAILQYVVTISNLSTSVTYRQVALTAAKAALDYGKEEFDGNASYNGTLTPGGVLGERDMFQNATYRVTYQLTVIPGGQSADGRSLKVQGIGRIYIPASSTNARYTRTINGEVIRSTIVSKTPSDFSPMAWYDATCNAATSADAACQGDTLLKSSGSTPVGINPSSLREERADGFYCGGAPSTAIDTNLAFMTAGECGVSPTHQFVGLMFSNTGSIPQGSTVSSANIQFTAHQANNGTMTYLIRGIAADNAADFTTGASAQITNATYTSASTTWTLPTGTTGSGPWTLNSTTNAMTPNIGPIIQEIVNRPGWQPGNKIGIVMSRVSGAITRKAKHTPITLTVNLDNYVAANNNEAVAIWKDRSGNGLHMPAVNSASPPIKKTILQTPTTSPLYNKPMVQVTTSTNGYKADLPGSSGRVSNSYTVFAVMRVLSGTYGSVSPNDDGGSLVGFYGTGTGNDERIPFWRHPYQGFHSYDSGTSANPDNICIAKNMGEHICKTYGSTINTTSAWVMYSAREALTERNMLLRRNGANNTFGQPQFYTPFTLNAPYQITVGTDSRLLSARTQADFGEVIIYDHALTCPQMEGVEQYLADKWGLNHADTTSTSKWQSEGCAENSIPAY